MDNIDKLVPQSLTIAQDLQAKILHQYFVQVGKKGGQSKTERKQHSSSRNLALARQRRWAKKD